LRVPGTLIRCPLVLLPPIWHPRRRSRAAVRMYMSAFANVAGKPCAFSILLPVIAYRRKSRRTVKMKRHVRLVFPGRARPADPTQLAPPPADRARASGCNDAMMDGTIPDESAVSTRWARLWRYRSAPGAKGNPRKLCSMTCAGTIWPLVMPAVFVGAPTCCTHAAMGAFNAGDRLPFCPPQTSHRSMRGASPDSPLSF